MQESLDLLNTTIVRNKIKVLVRQNVCKTLDLILKVAFTKWENKLLFLKYLEAD